jgi:short-subunit dehydrogenase
MAHEESKEARFIRVAEARTNKIINMVQLLGNCANRSTYEYTKEDVQKIFNAIQEELRQAKAKFEIAESESTKKGFSLRK